MSEVVSAPGRVHVIACGVLGIDLRHIAKELNLQLTFDFLPGGLHSSPTLLRQKLQEAIDRASAANPVDLLAIGYGICGRGTVGIQSRNIPLAIPRVHDCIGLFLGSDAAYRREFAKYPGTYYISAGWAEEKVQPQSTDKKASGDDVSACGDTTVRYRRLVEDYGPDNADAIRHFLNSWQRNYQRAAFIDTGAAGRGKYADIAQAMAREFGWKYEALSGSGELLRRMLLCRKTDEHVLWVPPHHVTIYDPMRRGLDAAPIWRQDQTHKQDQVIVVEGSDGEDASASHPAARIGLGIDAGGTYTDVVLYDFAGDKPIQKAKSLTTKWDFTLGIGRALDQLDAGRLATVDLVAISTTLATNAVVEGRGQKVGLLIMPPYGLFDDEDIAHRPIAVIKGKLEIDGNEIEPIDPEQVAQVVRRMVAEQHVGAFAVGGYASHNNPAHEMAVRQIIERETGLTVTCGYDVSEQLDYRVRSQTAALNARIIPNLVAFLDQCAASLRQRRIDAPMMIVRSDGSLMGVAAARKRPIETLLCGPAASVAGARYLTKADNAFVVDMGGTTTDTAAVVNGLVRTNRLGACVGGWQTHVGALDMRTVGLGGDSLIAVEKTSLKIGPRRVAPVAWLGHAQPGLSEALDWIEARLGGFSSLTALMEIFALNHDGDDFPLEEHERAIVEVLRHRPHSAYELAEKVNQRWWQSLRIGRLEERHLVQRCGLTPTDLLHVSGSFSRWDAASAARLCDLCARVLGKSRAVFIDDVTSRIVRELATEVLRKQLDEQADPRDLEKSAAARALLDNWRNGGDGAYQVRIKLHRLIIGIGAPTHHYLPQAAKLLETEAITPPDADVANAIGAITSCVRIHKQVEISPTETGQYALHGLPGNRVFAEFTDAQRCAIDEVVKVVRRTAREAGTSHGRVEVVIHDRVAPLSDGGTVFIGQRIEARLSGQPNLAVA